MNVNLQVLINLIQNKPIETEAEMLISLYALVEENKAKYQREDFNCTFTSYSELSKAWGCHRDKVKRFLAQLEKDNVIKIAVLDRKQEEVRSFVESMNISKDKNLIISF